LNVARELATLGYAKARHYGGGKQEWAEAGLPFEGRSA